MCFPLSHLPLIVPLPSNACWRGRKVSLCFRELDHLIELQTSIEVISRQIFLGNSTTQVSLPPNLSMEVYAWHFSPLSLTGKLSCQLSVENQTMWQQLEAKEKKKIILMSNSWKYPCFHWLWRTLCWNTHFPVHWLRFHVFDHLLFLCCVLRIVPNWQVFHFESHGGPDWRLWHWLHHWFGHSSLSLFSPLLWY